MPHAYVTQTLHISGLTYYSMSVKCDNAAKPEPNAEQPEPTIFNTHAENVF